jgi:hypothetical protein
MASKIPTKPLYAKLPISLHIGLQKLSLERFEKTGKKPSQTELLSQAVRGLLRREQIEISQIEMRVSEWNAERGRRSKVTIFPKKPKRT